MSSPTLFINITSCKCQQNKEQERKNQKEKKHPQAQGQTFQRPFKTYIGKKHVKGAVTDE